MIDFNIKFFGPNHPKTERVALVISDCLWQQCHVNKAANLQDQILQQNLKALVPDHPRMLGIMDKLGESCRQQGQFAESIDLLTNAMHGIKSQLLTSDPAIYHAMEQLGITMRICFHFKDAWQYQKKAVEGMKSYLGEKNMRIIISMEKLAITYKDLGTMLLTTKTKLAKQYLETTHAHANFVVEQRKEQLGNIQPHTWIAQGTFGCIKAAIREVDKAKQIFSSTLPVTARHLGDNH